MNQPIKLHIVNTHWAHIFIAGDPATVRQVLREKCIERGLCVTVETCDFIYTGGMESGVKVGLVNYPRFPADNETIKATAIHLAECLIERCCQMTALIVTPETTHWLTRRDEWR